MPRSSSPSRFAPICTALLVAPLLLAPACTAKHGSAGEHNSGGSVANGVVDEGQASLEWRTDDDANDAIPVSLTASDGTGLRLLDYQARAVIEGPLAFTELDLKFENPEARVREGRFEINLPPGAAISRFSMKVNGQWQEAEVVERQAARRAYEDFLHRKQDPALLEKKAGNQFRARVFPIPANGVKEIKVSYSQELRSAGEPYRVMLRGLPRLERLDVDVAIARGPNAATANMSSSMGGKASTVEHLRVTEQAVAPRADLEVRMSTPVSQQGLRAGDLAVARIKPQLEMGADPIEGLTLLVDTSASRALGWRGQVDRVGALVTALAAQGKDFPLQVIAFDQSSELLYEGPASGFAANGQSKLAKRRPLGASDLQGALARLATDLRPQGRVLVLSDGITTMGASDHAALHEVSKSLAARGVQRVDAIVDGGIQDEATLRALTRGALPHDGIVASARLTQASLVQKLNAETRSGIGVQVEGASWVWPQTLDGVQPGDEVLVYAQLEADKPFAVTLAGETATQQVDVAMVRTEGKLLERAAAMANIERMQAALTAMDPSQKEQRKRMREAIVNLSTAKRVLSDYTALLVLETDADYARFGIDRTALVDILTVGPGGLEMMSRAQAKPEPEPVPEPDAIALPPDNKPTTTRTVRAKGKADKKEVAQGLDALFGDADKDGGDFEQAEVEEELARNFDPDEADRSQGQRHAGEEGRMGRPARRSGRDFVDEAPPPAAEAEPAPDSGSFAVGNDDADVWGGLTGEEIGEAYGVGGLGLVGTGRGGGGTGEGQRIGLGNGSGYGRGSGAGFGGRGRRVPRVRQGQAEVTGSLDREVIRRIVRAHINEVRACYNQGLSRDPNMSGRVMIDFALDPTGSVSRSSVSQTTLSDSRVEQCIASAVKRWRFPRPPGGGVVTVRYPFVLNAAGGTPSTPDTAGPSARIQIPQVKPEDAWTGRFATVMGSLRSGAVDLAMDDAWAWREAEPGSELALLALGEAAEAKQDWQTASRAYGSLIDLFPSRADIRRMAGERLERVASKGHTPALTLAIDTYRQAVEQRPDHPASHRLLAYALAKAGQHSQAFAAIEAGASRSYPGGRFAGVDQILREDMSLIGAAWLAADPKAEAEITRRLQAKGLGLDRQPSTRFVLNWETDANDVDFHIYDQRGGHAYYSQKNLPSGGRLYADVTTGYGPECFTIPGQANAGPYVLQAHYYAMGPMGYGMGKLQVIEHDGKGGLKFTENPFVIMKDHAYVNLGVHPGQ